MQSNLHRVSESAIAAKSNTKVPAAKPDGKVPFKRLRNPESDTESEVDDTVVSGQITPTMSEFKMQGHVVSDSMRDSPLPDNIEVDPTVFLSFDWENEGPYEKAVERYI